MRKITSIFSLVGMLAILAPVDTTVVVSLYPQAAHAQTQGMDRRASRRGTRQDARAGKHACNAAQGTTRAECRQGKRHEKQSARGTH